MSAVLEVSLETVTYEGSSVPALSGVEFSVGEGEFVVVSGRVGAGKSTLCHCLAGAIPCYYSAEVDGKIRVAGRDLGGAPIGELAGIIGYLAQESQAQIVEGTVAEDVAFGPCNLGLPRGEVRRRVESCLEWVGLSGFETRDPQTLSGGEAQRAVLAGVIALHPRLLILDEPLAELDPSGRRLVAQGLRELSRRGTSVLLATTRPDQVRPFADRTVSLSPGGEHPSANPSGVGGVGKSGAATRLGIGSRSPEGRPEKHVPGEPGVRFDRCTHVYPGGRAGCTDVDLFLEPGGMVALLGVNGSGKTTLGKHVNGLLRATTGSVLVDGIDPAGKARGLLRARTGFVFQNPDYQLFGNSVEEELAFGLRVRGTARDEIKRRVDDAVSRFGLERWRSAHPHRLSRGQRQLLAVAGVLAADPSVLAADEPTSGLDPETALHVLRELGSVAARGGTVLLMTHDAELASTVVDRLAVMEAGFLRSSMLPSRQRVAG